LLQASTLLVWVLIPPGSSGEQRKTAAAAGAVDKMMIWQPSSISDDQHRIVKNAMPEDGFWGCSQQHSTCAVSAIWATALAPSSTGHVAQARQQAAAQLSAIIPAPSDTMGHAKHQQLLSDQTAAFRLAALRQH
jgi:hypothetical protein